MLTLVMGVTGCAQEESRAPASVVSPAATAAAERSITGDQVAADSAAGEPASEAPAGQATASSRSTAALERSVVSEELDIYRLIHTPCKPRGGSLDAGSVKWSSDGAAIVFGFAAAEYGVGAVAIYGAAADGARLWRIARVADRESVTVPFDIAPNNAHLVYATCEYAPAHDDEPYAIEIVRSAIDGTEPQRLTVNKSIDNYPAWSPDGTRIAYLVDFILYTMAADGSDARSVQPGRRGVVAHQPPRWSPDGGQLAYVRFEGVGQWWHTGPVGLYTIAVDGTDSRRLTTAVSGPSWSPDGERLAFAKAEETEVALYTVAADGSDAQRVTTIEGWRARQYREPDPTRAWIDTVAWSPAGEQILYTCGAAVCVVTVDGTWVGQSPGKLDEPQPSVRPGAPVAPAWSPDGARIAVVRTPETAANIVLYTIAPDGTDLRMLVRRDADAGLQAVGTRGPGGPVDVAGCAAGAAVPDPAANPGLVRDCETLLAMRDVLAGSTELDWSADRPMTEWDGVELGGAPPRVSRLKLDWRGLSGVIPSALGRLTQLRALDLRVNWLGGEIPAELGSLAELQELLLDRNYLSGEIPPELGGLTQLSALQLTQNYLHGIIPPELGQLANLEVLDLGVNHLTGGIPMEFGQLANLTFLYLAGNQLTGCIPTALQEMLDSLAVRSLGLPDCEPAR